MPFVGTNVDTIFLLYSYYYRNNCALSLLPACLCDHIRSDQSNAPTFRVENRGGNQHVLSESVNQTCPGCIRRPACAWSGHEQWCFVQDLWVLGSLVGASVQLDTGKLRQRSHFFHFFFRSKSFVKGWAHDAFECRTRCCEII